MARRPVTIQSKYYAESGYISSREKPPTKKQLEYYYKLAEVLNEHGLLKDGTYPNWSSALCSESIRSMRLLCYKNGIHPSGAPVKPIKELVAVVRCKHCEHRNARTSGCTRNPSVNPWAPDDYCSYGELRADLREEGDK